MKNANVYLIVSILFFFLPLQFHVDSASCDASSNVLYKRYVNIVIHAWDKCWDKIKGRCNGLGPSVFCGEDVCNLSYDEWESIKPTEKCKPRPGSDGKLCKLLFNSTLCAPVPPVLSSSSPTGTPMMSSILHACFSLLFSLCFWKMIYCKN